MTEPVPGAAPAALERHGFALLPSLLDDLECDAIAGHLDVAPAGRAGSRTLLSHPWCQALAQRLSRDVARAALLPPGLVAVQCTSFEKSSARNWLVPFHQDLGIAVAERVEHAQLQGWSEKEGGQYVQVPGNLSVPYRLSHNRRPTTSQAERIRQPNVVLDHEAGTGVH